MILFNIPIDRPTMFIVLIAAIVPYIYLKGKIKRYREELKPDQIVGIVFGDYAVNRKIRSMSSDEVQVKSLNGNNFVSVKKYNVYMPDPYAQLDEFIEVDQKS